MSIMDSFKLVTDHWIPGEGWNRALLKHHFTPHDLDMVAPILIRDGESDEDTISWGPPSGTFSTKSAYELAATDPRDRVGGPWKQI